MSMDTNRSADLPRGPSYADVREEAARIEEEHQVYADIIVRPMSIEKRYRYSGFRVTVELRGREAGKYKRLECGAAEFSRAGWRTLPAAILWALQQAEEKLIAAGTPLDRVLARA